MQSQPDIPQSQQPTPIAPLWPQLGTVGLDGVIVRFSDTLTRDANRATLSFAAALKQAPPVGTMEVTSALASVLVRFDTTQTSRQNVTDVLQDMMMSQDWSVVPLSGTQSLWSVPTIYGGDLAPDFAAICADVGLSEDQAIASLADTPVQVQALGFAPGQPYLGQLSPEWDIPRQTGLTPRVKAGALVVAIRQLVLFAVSAPTGWRQVGQTAFPLFDPMRRPPTLLTPGDQVRFVPAPREDWEHLQADPMGGATQTPIQP